MSHILNPFGRFNPEEARYKILEFSPSFLGDILLNGWILKDGKEVRGLKIEGLPADVKIQAIRFDDMRNVVQFRLWSLEWPIVSTMQEIERLSLMLTAYRYVIVEPAGEGPPYTLGKVKLEEKRGYEFL